MTPPIIHNVPRHGMSRWSTAPRLSMPRKMKHPRSLRNNVSQSRKSQDPFCTTRAVEPSALMPLNDIATEQNKATEKTQAATNQLLDYLATHPDATIRYHASDMILNIHSDAYYLSVSNAWSRLGGLFFRGNKAPEQETLSGSILNVAAVIKNVVASAAESEVGACFDNGQSGAPLRVTLTELGHTQPPTHLRTDNSTAYDIINEMIKQKRSKAMDM
jgi:hypothetical protein